MKNIPTAADGKKWVLLTAELISVAGMWNRNAVTGKDASVLSVIKRLEESYLSRPNELAGAFLAGAQSLWKEGRFSPLSQVVMATIEEITREFVVAQAQQESLEHLWDGVARKWDHLAPTPLQEEELANYLLVSAAGRTEDPLGLRQWQAVAAYLCRREEPGQARIAYLFSPVTISALAYRLAQEFPERLPRRLLRVPAGEPTVMLLRSIEGTDTLSVSESGRPAFIAGQRTGRDAILAASGVHQ